MPDAQHPGEDEMAVALNRVLAEGDTYELMDTLARAHRMGRIAQQTGLGEKSLYNPCGPEPGPRWAP